MGTSWWGKAWGPKWWDKAWGPNWWDKAWGPNWWGKQWQGGLSLTGGANIQTAAPPHAHTHTHTHTHPAFLSEFLISLQGRMQDFGEEGVGSTWIIDVLTTGRGARKFFHRLYCKLRQSTPINSALCSSSTITTKTGSN